MTDSGLVISGLRAGYGKVAVLRDVDVAVRPGEIVALLGPNGGGKSTTLLASSGLADVTQGDIRLDGTTLVGLSPTRIVRAGLVHVPEDRSLFGSMTVEENLRVASSADLSPMWELFPELERMSNRRAALLSGGEQQMLCLARALRCDPKALLVDEMSLGLAPLIVERLFVALEQLVSTTNVGVLVVEQHVHVALKYVSRGYVMSGGRVTAEGSARELEARWEDIEASYLGVTSAA